jgi:hypothetical protein
LLCVDEVVAPQNMPDRVEVQQAEAYAQVVPGRTPVDKPENRTSGGPEYDIAPRRLG